MAHLVTNVEWCCIPPRSNSSISMCLSGAGVDETRWGYITSLPSSTPYTFIDRLFAAVKGPTVERGKGKRREEKSYLSMCSAYLLIRSVGASTGCIPANTAHLKQSSPVPVTLMTALFAWIHGGSGMYALPRKGSSCHNVNWRDSKWENTHPDPFN